MFLRLRDNRRVPSTGTLQTGLNIRYDSLSSVCILKRSISFTITLGRLQYIHALSSASPLHTSKTSKEGEIFLNYSLRSSSQFLIPNGLHFRIVTHYLPPTYRNCPYL